MAALPEIVHEEKLRARPAGNIIAENVSAEEYMDRYAEHFCEWVEGYVIKMSPIHVRHFIVTDYLATSFRIYCRRTKVGVYRVAPFLMKLSEMVKREPDLMIILKENYGKLKPMLVESAADIVIEVLSPGTEVTDRGEKFTEYEKFGVREYWLLDVIREETLFYRLNDQGIFMPQRPDANENYRTPLLPGFVLHIPTLWLDEDDMPDTAQILQDVEKMIKG